MNLRAGLVVASLLVLAGCASMEHDGHGGGFTKGSCTMQQCPKIIVSVDACQVTVDQPSMDVQRGNHEVHMAWTLDVASRMAGYTFADPAIVIKSPTPPPGEFHDPTPGRYTTELQNRNSRAATYTYAVKVNRWGTACNPGDPTIVNQG